MEPLADLAAAFAWKEASAERVTRISREARAGKNRVGERVEFREAHLSTMEVEVMQNLAHNRRLIIGLVLAIAVIAVIVLIVAYSGGGGGGGY